MLLNPYFGQYGGQFVPELLLPALDQLERAYVDAKDDPAFRTELDRLLTTYAGRPTPLTRLTRLTEGTKTTIYLKREDLLHGGAHELHPEDVGLLALNVLGAHVDPALEAE